MFFVNLKLNLFSRVLLLLLTIVILFTIVTIHPFLSINQPVKADILVVEGGLLDPYLQLAVSEFSKGNYKHLITVGSEAELAAIKITNYGLDKKSITSVPAYDTTKHGTYMSYMALKNWLSLSSENVKTLNIITANVQARKSFLICKKVLGPDFLVGIIAIPPLEYNSTYWYLSVRAIKSVLKNSISYIYTLFWPY